MSNDINALFQTAKADGNISQTSLQILTGPAMNQMQAAMGILVDDVGAADDVVLVAELIDDTMSIGSNAPNIITGHNTVLGALQGSKQASSILMHTRYMYSAKTLFPFVCINDAIPMSGLNYSANGTSTPLYDQSIVMLGSVLAKTQEFADQGVAARSVSLIVTDGGDNASRHRAAEVKAIVDDMLQAEKHIVAFLGIGQDTTFRRIALDMGIPDKWILTTGSSASEIRQAFNMFSRSAVRASQGGPQSFSQNAGFW